MSRLAFIDPLYFQIPVNSTITWLVLTNCASL